MNIISLISFFTFIVTTYLGIQIYTKNRRSWYNRAFFIICLCMSIWAFGLTFFYPALTVKEAHFWFQVGMIGFFLYPACMVHFISMITKSSDKKESSYMYFLLYIPAFILISQIFVGFPMVEKYIQSSLGWHAIGSINNPWLWLLLVYAGIYDGYCVYALYKLKKVSRSDSEKRQANILFICLIIPFSINMFTALFFHTIVLVNFTNIEQIWNLVWIFGLFYVIKRYRIITLGPQVSLDEVSLSIADILIYIDRDSNILNYNEHAKQLLEYDELELHKKPFEKIIVSNQVFKKKLKSLIKDFKPFHNIKLNFLSSVNLQIPTICSGTVVKDNYGYLHGFAIIGQDAREVTRLEDEIEKRKKVEAALINSELQYRTTIDHMDEMIFVVNKDLEIILYNQGLVEFINKFHREAELLCASIKKAFSFFDNSFYEEYNEVFQRKQMMFSETKCEINGRVFIFDVKKIPIVERNKVTKIITAITDITERKAFEDRLQRTEKLESIGVLAGGIAHDFNNILMGIIGNIELMGLYADTHDELNSLLAESKKASHKAKGLTKQLLTFSKGDVLVKKTGSIIHDIQETTNFLLRGSSIKCNYKIDNKLWSVDYDKNQMNRVFHNLIINAKEAMPKGGTIIVEATNLLVKKNESEIMKPGKYVKIIIIDKGIGINKLHLSKIFDPYFSTKSFGSGLGLTTAYSIIKKHNGDISVYSEEKQGTTFEIILPASDKKIKKHSKNKLVPESKIVSGNFLIVDDEEIVRTVTQKMFMHLGHKCVAVDNSNDAIEKYIKSIKSKKPFDGVLLDLTLPGDISGVEILENLKKINPQIKAIACSGYSNNPVMANFKNYGFVECIKKPYEMKNLNKVLQDILSKKNK